MMEKALGHVAMERSAMLRTLRERTSAGAAGSRGGWKAHAVAAVAALAICCAPATGWSGEKKAGEEERIPFALPSLKANKMPPVFFSHDRHTAAVEAQGKDCTTCHVEDDSGMSEYFLKSDKVAPDQQVAYVHEACVSCHAATKKPTGPLLVYCRSCHSSEVAAAQEKKSGK